MRRRMTCVAATLLVAACTVALWMGRHAPTPVQAAPNSSPEANRLVVHEWGTFTTYSGSDGGRLEFRPLFDSDLPPFVLDRSMQSGLGIFSKSNYRALVRMETPITYFYTDRMQDVNVRVDFPRGLLTEFYPPVQAMSPPYRGIGKEPTENSSLDWGRVTLIPPQTLRVSSGNEQIDAAVAERLEQGLLPQAREPSHYFPARATDSALVFVHRPHEPTLNLGLAPHGSFFEKFLFYRGIGNFDLPMQVVAQADGRLQIHNLSHDTIRSMIVVHVDEAGTRYAELGDLPAQGQLEAITPVEPRNPQALGEVLVRALQSAGLYEKEARAMVATWRDSWFGEYGTRVLYLVPEIMVDEMLPLHVDPKPAETVRVMVGRMEVMTASDEARMADLVAASAKARAESWARAKANGTKDAYEVPAEIRALGRWAEPALTRIRHIHPDRSVSDEAGLLLDQLRPE